MLCLMLAAIEVVSFNIRYDNPADGPNAWSHRQQTVSSYLMQSRADFIGLQEVLPSQLAELKPKLSDYKLISRTREADEGKGESAPPVSPEAVADRQCPPRHDVAIHPAGQAWFKELGQQPSPNLHLGQIREDGNGEPKAVWVMNTHFDHRGQTARLKSARLIRQKIEQRPKEMAHEPVIVLGDLNTLPGTPPILTLGMADALRDSASGTWNGWDAENRTGALISSSPVSWRSFLERSTLSPQTRVAPPAITGRSGLFFRPRGVPLTMSGSQAEVVVVGAALPVSLPPSTRRRGRDVLLLDGEENRSQNFGRRRWPMQRHPPCGDRA